MANFSWAINRLRAMSVPEVLWRLSQKAIQKREELKFGEKRKSVTSSVFDDKLSSLHPNCSRLHLNFMNERYGLNMSIHLLAGEIYDLHKFDWNAGFQTKNKWPDTFSYRLEYKQRDDIGDARTNWELNRHFQFALLAKDYAASREQQYLDEFRALFSDWNETNSFLHGISWTSVMEVAIRCSNWCYAYAFLEHGGVDEDLLNELRIGIINMTDYVVNHYSRYSSANNHLIVEAYSIGQSGILFDNKTWIDLAVEILTEELSKQNYSDGVNKEMSLHYQSFYMEAMGLMMRLMTKNGISVPVIWKTMLTNMSQYVADCMGDYGEIVVFGDDDEGKILDLQGGEINHYTYVLGMMSILLTKRYVKDFDCETLRWLFTEDEVESAAAKEQYIPSQYCCYMEGGNTILRSKDRKVLIGVDHAALGFGSLAAHGHADALSFQLFYEGKPVFVDPGTYIYHCDIGMHNEFRETRNHNTVCLDNRNQSEMLGAFLWGRKANADLVAFEEKSGTVRLVIQQDGYKPVIHKRTIEFDGNRVLSIRDELSKAAQAVVILNVDPGLDIEKTQESISIKNEKVTVSLKTNNAQIRDYFISPCYGEIRKANQVSISFTTESSITIRITDLGV